MTPLTNPISVVVIGGGYAGTVAANRLQMRKDVGVTLVNPRPWFVERIRLHQLVADSGSATVDYADMLNPKVHLVIDAATEINATSRTVRLASGGGLRYDYLIYAVGSTGAVPSVPGASQFAWQISDFEHAHSLRGRVAELHPEAAGVRGRRRADRNRDVRRARRAAARRRSDTDLRPDAGPVAERTRSAIGGPSARPPRRAGRGRYRHRSASRRGGDVRR